MNKVKSLERGLDILRCFGPEAVALTVHDIACRARLPRPSVYRFIKTLVHRQFMVELDEDRQQRRYAIGPAVFGLARIALGDAELRRCAHPIMSSLAEKVGESVYLSVRHGVNAVCVESIETSAPLRFGQRVGFSCPLYAGTAKAILAFLHPERRDLVIRQLRFRPLTSRTIRSRRELLRRLARIQRRGYEISQGEVFEGTKAIGAPVFDERGAAFAILTVGAPEARISADNEARIQDLVLKGAHGITMRLHRGRPAGVVFLERGGRGRGLKDKHARAVRIAAPGAKGRRGPMEERSMGDARRGLP